MAFAVAACGPAIARSAGAPTDYQAELETLDAAIRDTEDFEAPTVSDPRPAANPFQSLRRLHLLHQRALLTSEPEDFARIETAMARAIDEQPGSQEVLFLRARLHFNRHRLAKASGDLLRLSSLASHPVVRVLEADVALQMGNVHAARKTYREVLETRRTWDNLARLAYLERIYGSPDDADRLYAQAQEEITAKEMRAYAWVEVQRGVLDLECGRAEEALAHYRRADAAYSGYWLVEEHQAEALAALGRYPEAIALYEKLLSQTHRPELHQALGDLHLFLGDTRAAELRHREALKVYLDSAERGESQYLHHLSGLYADALPDATESVRWAKKDVALRPNYATRDMLAWALYRQGDLTNALTEIRTALKTGARSVHLYVHAAQILTAFGHLDEARACQRKAAAIHPRYQAVFHVHR